MIINASAISMASSRSYQKVTSNTRISSEPYRKEEDTKKDSSNKLSSSGKQMSSDMRNKLRYLDKEAGQRQAGALSGSTETGFNKAESPEDIKLQVLKRILEGLNKRNNRKSLSFELEYKSIKATSFGFVENTSQGSSSKLPQANVWKRQTIVSSFMAETENTAFSTTGIVKTADGRELSFNVQLEMSRSYMEHFTYMREEDVVFTDPLVINLDTNVAGVSDQKFLFDLDSDGAMEEISFLNQGSGFLALDKNGDGKINDGSELFGTQSGDGFKDLSQYDDDNNGWIDENDAVFKRLKVWTKNEDGTDRLINLKEAGVGAIFLGNASTEFSLKNQQEHTANGIIRSTGIYLKESGEAGTVQHIDFAV